MSILFSVQVALGQPLTIPNKAQMTAWFRAALPPQIKDSEVALKIVDIEEGTRLNQQYRGKTGPTNVLSFPYTLPGREVGWLLGDLAICAPLVAEEAAAQGKSLEAHWAHLVIHGTLHLLGYDHIEEKDAEIMESLEIDIMKRLGFASPYREKA